jgi:hypothetical protein
MIPIYCTYSWENMESRKLGNGRRRSFITRQKETTQSLFRTFRVIYIHQRAIFSAWIGFSYYLSNISIITFIYTIIRIGIKLNPFLLIFFVCTVLVLIGALVPFYSLALKIRSISVEVIASYFDHGCGDRFWKSCRPFEFSVGGQFTISSRSFYFEVFCDLIMSRVLDLLLTFR